MSLMDWLRKGAEKAVESGRQMVELNQMARRYTESPPAIAFFEMQAKIPHLDEASFQRLIGLLDLTISAEQQNLHRLVAASRAAGTGESESSLARDAVEGDAVEAESASQAVSTAQARLERMIWVKVQALQIRVGAGEAPGTRPGETPARPAGATGVPGNPFAAPDRPAGATGVPGNPFAAAPAPPIPAPAGPAPDAAAAAGGGAPHLAMLAMLEKQFEAEKASGNMTPARQQMLTAVMRELRQILERPGESVEDLVRKDSEVRELLARMTDAVGSPTRPKDREGPAAGTRALELVELVRRMEAWVLQEHQRPHPGDAERDMLSELHMRCIEAKNAVFEVEGDEEAVALERELLRPLALDVTRAALRYHITIAHPRWPSSSMPAAPNGVYFAGDIAADDVRRACESRGLEILSGFAGRDPARAAWDRLRTCHIAIFDLAGWSAQADIETRARTAAACHDLGIALALGRGIVVIAMEGGATPFDVDIEPVRIARDGEDAVRIGHALDAAIYVPQRGGADTSLDETVAQVRSLVGGDASAFVRQTIDMITGDAARDPVRVGHLLEHAFGFAVAEAPRILRPAFPGAYPDRERKCFHVTAFGPDWAMSTMQAVRETCEAASVRYVRGDQVLDPDIIRSIWDNIATATHVLVDMTGLNPNAALELGIAHTLGRRTMVLTQELGELALVPSLARVRAHAYTMDNGAAELRNHVERFVST